MTFDTTKPDGSPRRQSDNRKAEERLGFTATTRLAEGLREPLNGIEPMSACVSLPDFLGL